MTDWLTRAAELIGDHEPLILATVCGVDGSAPREAGAKMLVTADGFSGTIGGGALEYSAIARARKMLAEGSEECLFEDFPLGPALGQCCGGRVRIFYERLAARDLEWLRQAEKTIAKGESIILERALPDRKSGETRRRVTPTGASFQDTPAIAFFDEDGAALPHSMPPLEQCSGFREMIADRRVRVYVFGAGHVGTAIAAILRTMPAITTWVDRRADVFPAAVGGAATIIQTDDELNVAAKAPAGACYFILTHSHQLDYELAREVLRRDDSAYCGLIGSQTKRARFERRLRRAGVDEAALRRLSCPIGGGGLESKSPAIIALAAVHEMFLAHQAHARNNRHWK